MTHPKHANAHDDVAAVVCGAIMTALQAAKRAAFEPKIVVPFVAGEPRYVPGGCSLVYEPVAAPFAASAASPSAPAAPPSPPVLNAPVVARSGAETRAAMDRVNSDRSAFFRSTNASFRAWRIRSRLPSWRPIS